MLVIGLTGGIGTGKTEVAKILRGLGASVINADELAHRVYRRGTPGWREVVAGFGEEVLGRDGEVDRARLGAIVFGDEAARRRLNAIVHPRVREMIEARIRELDEAGTEVVVAEVPLLIEAKMQEAAWVSLVDETWVTDAPEETVLERLRRRGGISDDQARGRIRAQMDRSERLGHADVVVDNSDGPDELATAVTELWQERLSLHEERASEE